ncbi:uncharacterized protein LOC142574155 isoform X3 [Dermacentor variabilis]|uniref:uncharacterized protein LOC142574155 isoform X3 n=1 Tax=Dermacentor variabilis TaxID=34621 RepID=UPI003F5C50EB
MHLGRNTCYLMLLVAVLAAGGRTEQNAERCHEGAMSEKEEHSEELGCRGRSQRDHNRFLAHRDSTMESAIAADVCAPSMKCLYGTSETNVCFNA